MDVLSGPVVVLDSDDCAVLGRQLVEAVRLAYVARGRPPPHHLLDFASAVNRAARSSPSSAKMPTPAPLTEQPRSAATRACKALASR